MQLSPEEHSKTVINSRIINAPIEDVFDAYANPEKIVRWWGPQGFTVINESIDLREGGHWHFVLKSPDGQEFKNHQIFERIEKPHQFVVNHVTGPIYRGTVTFDDIGSSTRVTMYWTFDNADFVAKAREAISNGNEGNFDRLTELLAGGR